jgi:hypothetical protein
MENQGKVVVEVNHEELQKALEEQHPDGIQMETRSYWFNDDFTFETIDRLTQELESLFTCTDNVNLYLTSQGGDLAAMMYLWDFMENNREKITLVANYSIASAGFFLFVHYTGNRKVLPCTSGMLHNGEMMMSFRNIKDKHGHEQFYFRKKNKNDEYLITPIKDKLTQKELKRFYKGEDIYISEERLRELIR